jgi:hypothetical protein
MPRSTRQVCSICGARRVLTALSGAICTPCAKRFGLPDEPIEWPRPRNPCVRCGHEVLVAYVARQRAAVGLLAPLAATFERKLKTTILTGEEEIEYDAAPDTGAPRGRWVAFTCRSCGFTEWYALEPEKIPIGPSYGTHLFVTGRTPYR